MKALHRKKFRELERMVDEIEEQADLYEETEDWHIDGEEGAVSLDISRYVLEPEEDFLEKWVDVHDSMKEYSRKIPMKKKYRELDGRIFDNREFLEEVYRMEKPLGRKKVEARYR